MASDMVDDETGAQRIAQAEPPRGDHDGFTLVELLIVVLVVGLLMAIAIPVYLGLISGAKRVQAQSNLQIALQVAKDIRQIDGHWPGGGQPHTQAQFEMGEYAADAPNFTWTSVENIGPIGGGPSSPRGSYPENYSYGNQRSNEIYVNVWIPVGINPSLADSLELSTQASDGRCYIMEDLSLNQGASEEIGYSIQAGPICFKPPVPNQVAAGRASDNVVTSSQNTPWSTWFTSW